MWKTVPPSLRVGIVSGAIVISALIAWAVVDIVMDARARSLPSVDRDITDDERGALERTIAEAEAILAVDAQNFSTHVTLARAKADLGDLDGAAEVYRKMNQRFPRNFLSFQNLGNLYEETERYEFAAEQFFHAIDNAPRDPHQYRNIVNLYTYKLTERREDIPRILQKGLAELPGSVDLMAMMATYYRDTGDRDEAIRWYELLLVFDQENESIISEVQALKAASVNGAE
jgi:tetratricopeptide (TPR) repeat protein